VNAGERGGGGLEPDRAKITWIDALSFVGFLAALYVIYRLLRKSEWPGISAEHVIFLIAAGLVGIASLLLGGAILLSVIRSMENGSRCTFYLCVTAANRAILSKYIPGKIWYIVGISESLVQVGMSRMRSWIVVLTYQVVLIGSALIVGLAGVWGLQVNVSAFRHFSGSASSWVTAGIVIAIVAATFFAWRRLSTRGEGAGKTVAISVVHPNWLLAAILTGVVHWLMQGLSVWMFLSGIQGSWLDATMILVVPAVYAIGFLVLIVPGGIGVRELLFTHYFLFIGMSIETASAMAILARCAAIASEAGVWLIVQINMRRGGPLRGRV